MQDYPGIKYVASDGKVFKTMELAMDHEDELEAVAEKRKKHSEEQARRMKEVDEAYKKYRDLKDKYYKDYPTSNDLDGIFERLFGI